ncbi:hypothetical protein RKE25_22095 (plasmid) [Dyella sp. BiH032]|uniref:hypothetical protein n=1 Tax=Dyella sp. BiH032 TaxID=3075430 RepID=UPI0028929B18|nr:hypothetical protein [Dyella sp. BiH032]WNL48423.1 hypothetical protein RKE25_22095 [Dyella sp. BiH032]
MNQPNTRGPGAVLSRLYVLSLFFIAGSMVLAGLKGLGVAWVPAFPWTVSIFAGLGVMLALRLALLFVPGR